MNLKEQYWKYSLIVIILFMGVIIFRQITPFLGGLLGAFTIYILVRTQMHHLTEKKKMKRSISALLITAETIFVFLVPLGLTIWMIVNKLQDINLAPQTFVEPIQQVAGFIKEKTGYDVLGKDTLSFIVSILPRIGQLIMSSISSLAVNLFVMIFVLYFMLIGGKKMEAYINDILPFNETNTREVIHEINMIVRSNAIGIPLLAIIQGGIAMIGYLIFGAPNVLLLGFLTCFATIIPMVGIALVWFPVASYLAISRIAVRQPDSLHPSKEDGGYTSVDYNLRSCYRSAVIRIYGNHLRSVITLVILSVRQYVQERIPGFIK